MENEQHNALCRKKPGEHEQRESEHNQQVEGNTDISEIPVQELPPEFATPVPVVDLVMCAVEVIEKIVFEFAVCQVMNDIDEQRPQYKYQAEFAQPCCNENDIGECFHVFDYWVAVIVEAKACPVFTTSLTKMSMSALTERWLMTATRRLYLPLRMV